MKRNEIRKVPFEGGELLGVKTEDGKVYLGVKKACLDIGLSDRQARLQVENIQHDIVLSKGVRNLGLLTKGGEQEVCCIAEQFVTLWLAKISLTPNMRKTNPQAVEKLLAYQLKAADALHEAFMATDEKKAEFYSELGLKEEIVELKEELSGMRSSLDKMVEYTSINSRQAQKILHAGKDRVNYLLGGAKSSEYKKWSRTYFKNMWLQFGERFEVSTYKDLSPVNMEEGYAFLKNWEYST